MQSLPEAHGEPAETLITLQHSVFSISEGITLKHWVHNSFFCTFIWERPPKNQTQDYNYSCTQMSDRVLFCFIEMDHCCSVQFGVHALCKWLQSFSHRAWKSCTVANALMWLNADKMVLLTGWAFCSFVQVNCQQKWLVVTAVKSPATMELVMQVKCCHCHCKGILNYTLECSCSWFYSSFLQICLSLFPPHSVAISILEFRVQLTSFTYFFV